MTFARYREALLEAGPKLKEIILAQAEQDKQISFQEFLRLCSLAYPEDPDTA